MEGDGVASGGGGTGLIDGVTSEELVDESIVETGVRTERSGKVGVTEVVRDGRETGTAEK